MGGGSEMAGPKPLRSVESALAVLEALGDGGAEHSVTDLSRSLGMSKAAVYRALVTLRTCGYVRQNPSTDRYALTLKCRRLAMAAHDGLARAVVPAHGPSDGDTFFALATGNRALEADVAARDFGDPAGRPAQLRELCAAAASTVTRAIVKAILAASSAGGFPSYLDLLPSACAR